jgi:hypothetical protein
VRCIDSREAFSPLVRFRKYAADIAGDRRAKVNSCLEGRQFAFRPTPLTCRFGSKWKVAKGRFEIFLCTFPRDLSRGRRFQGNCPVFRSWTVAVFAPDGVRRRPQSWVFLIVSLTPRCRGVPEMALQTYTLRTEKLLAVDASPFEAGPPSAIVRIGGRREERCPRRPWRPRLREPESSISNNPVSSLCKCFSSLDLACGFPHRSLHRR